MSQEKLQESRSKLQQSIYKQYYISLTQSRLVLVILIIKPLTANMESFHLTIELVHDILNNYLILKSHEIRNLRELET